MKKEYVLGMDIGGTRIRLGLVDERGNLANERMDLSERYNDEAFVEHLKKMIGEFAGGLNAGEGLAAISVGVPSTLSKDRKTVISTPNIVALNDIRLGAILEQQFQMPVFVERDVNFLLYHDCRRLSIPTDGIVVACYMGTGVGNAVCIDGKLMTGRNGVACELGHIPMMGNQLPCVCGNKGCVETLTSGKYLASLMEKLYPGESIGDVFVTHAQSREIDEFLEMMTLPVATEINIFDPDYVIMGGGVIAMKGFPKERFEEKLLRHVRKPVPAENLRLLYSCEDVLGGVLGGARYAFDNLHRAATGWL